MPPAANIFLQSALGAEQCVERLQEATDEPHRTLFSLSGYRGTKPILSQINGFTFQLQKRRNYRNDLAPNFYGTILPWGNGARVEGRFGPPRMAVIFLRIWLAFMILVSVPVCVTLLRDAHGRGNAYVGLLVEGVMIVCGVLAQRFGEWLGRNEKTFILQFLETTLAAHVAPAPPPNIG